MNKYVIGNIIVSFIFIGLSTYYTIRGYYKDTTKDVLSPLQAQIEQLKDLMRKQQEALRKDTYQVKMIPSMMPPKKP